uniref:Tetratricopeptide TPR_2 repeat protein n=1 Tax=Solibacter usitatus (strain Ellin6076) TaxID=234267 RepID=Q023W0_SOLUE
MRITLLMVLGLTVGWAQSDPGEVLRQWLEEGRAAVQAGQFDAAIARFQKALEAVDADSAAAGDLYLRIGETQRRKGDLDGAIQSLAHANDLLPGNATVVGTLALALDSRGNRSDAQRAYRATIELDPNNAIAMNNLAFLLAEEGTSFDEALQLARHAMALMPDSMQMTDTAGWVQLKRGDNDAAIALFSDAVAKEPAEDSFRDHLLMALERKGERAGIFGETISALKQAPSPENLAKVTSLLQGLK